MRTKKMTNGDSEWNRWRGEQTAILTLMQNEMVEHNNKLNIISKELYVMKGKVVAWGSIAGAVVAIIVTIIGGLI